MGKIQRDVVVIEALHDVAVEAGAKRHELHTRQHLRALQGHAARHDQADVTRTEDDAALARHVAQQVNKLLRGAGGVDAGAAGARGGQRAARTLAAAHRQNDRLRLDDLHPLRGRDAGHKVVFAVHVKDGGVGLDLDAHLGSLIDIALGVLGAGQLLLEAVEAKAVMDALAQDAARVMLTLDNEQIVDAVFLRRDGGSQTRRARADDEDVYKLLFHCLSPPSSSRPGCCPPAVGCCRRTW